MHKVCIYDSTLRDGAQAEGISFSVEDKLKIVSKLDELGVSYIEAGNPGSNPKDLEFFQRVKHMKLNNIKLTAFGSTRRVGINVEDDNNVQSLLKADTPAVAIFGKSWDLHVEDILKTTLEENLGMIEDTIRFFKGKGKEVVFDAEHFFDGYKQNREYATQALQAAVDGGADSLVLCDTNGGCFPLEISEITKEVCKRFDVPVGIHCHNDTGMAVANSIVAVQAGARQVQGTFNGFGERCGNADLCTIIPNLQIKLGIPCIAPDKIENITSAARFVSEIANVAHNERAPYVGNSSFAHKGGMHIDGVVKNPKTFEHIDPSSVGNERRFLMSEVAGRTTILSRINQVDASLTKNSPQTKQIVDRLKELEHQGYQFEGAESSFELVIRKELGKYKPFFDLNHFKVIVNEPSREEFSSSALIKVNVNGEEEITAAEGDGPVNALDKAMRKALERFYPQLNKMRLTDFKVRVLDSKTATAAKVRVLIESSDGESVWNTIGVSTDIIEASWKALVDSIEYKLQKDMEG
ncbi:MAG: citramalate synthase [Firmicutes bacterium]|nr:citramalate synthase [Bacillota bacterium]